MKKSCFKLTFFVLLVSLVLSLNSVSADTAISGSCNITAPGTYYLTNDINPGELAKSQTIINIFCSNVTLDGKGYTINGNYNSYGIVVRNNSKFIKNITIKNFKIKNLNRFGICVMNTSNSLILNNSIISAYDSIALMNSSNNTIKNNNISFSTRTAIEAVLGSNNNTIYNNTVSYAHFGIDIGRTLNNTVINNTLYNAGICVGGDYQGKLNSNITQWINHTIVNNTVNGKPIYYYKNNNSKKSIPEDAGQVILVNCSNMTLENLTINNVSIGIDIGFCSNITIKNITIGNNSMANILTYNLHNSNISNNIINSGRYGISMHYSNNNTICNNTISKFSDAGLIVATNCTTNTIENNEFHENIMDCVLDICFNNTVQSNRFTSDGLTILGSKIKYWNNHIIKNNTLDGKPIYYYKNNNSKKIPEDAGQVILVNCSNMIIENLNISNTTYGITIIQGKNCNFTNNLLTGNDWGIYMYYSNNISFKNNNVSSNNLSGIFSINSHNNTLINNTVNSNLYGITLRTVFNNTLINNTVNSNQYVGTYLISSINNTLSSNLLKNNEIGIYLSNLNDNAIYNNIFNNTENIKTGIVVGLNYWNTTKENGG
ncbi:parallel beta-helix repeat protein, partial [Methanococcus voltae PS]